jgi:D-alanyl-lipoteichoic acid acyltransferase DltB (MBOAT superfamily)
MKFNSFAFLLFFAAVVGAYYLIPWKKMQRLFLVAVSLFFIWQANILSVIVIVAVAVANYFLAMRIESAGNARRGGALFIFAVLLNVGNLFLFKYYDFFLVNVNAVLGTFDLRKSLPALHVLLPVGISFYTFQLLGYLIDVRRETMASEKNVWAFLNYVFFFPKLLAGPIERAQNFLTQSDAGTFRARHFSTGVKLLIWGFFQKLVIADRIAIYVNAVYNNIGMHGGMTLLACSVLYVFQVYADFSGYTDIARGLARMLGYELMVNFRRPLWASSIADFWRRWHISLSSWVGDYIYTPLSLRFRCWGVTGVLFALMISFVVVGIWHGARWTYVVFGVLQGLFLGFELLTAKHVKKAAAAFPAWIAAAFGKLATFLLIAFSLVFFRSPSLATAWNVLGRIGFGGRLFVKPASFFIYSLLGIALLMVREGIAECSGRDILQVRSKWFVFRSLPYALLLIMILAFGVFDGGQFIYFNF